MCAFTLKMCCIDKIIMMVWHIKVLILQLQTNVYTHALPHLANSA